MCIYMYIEEIDRRYILGMNIDGRCIGYEYNEYKWSIDMSMNEDLLKLKDKFVAECEDSWNEDEELLSLAIASPWTNLKEIRMLYCQLHGYSSTEGDEFLLDDLCTLNEGGIL